MFRRLFNLITTVSLILAFTAIVFWIRSYQNEDAICYGDPNASTFYLLMSKQGLISGERVEIPGHLEADYQRGLWGFSIPNLAKVGFGDVRSYRDATREDIPGVLIAKGHRRLLHGRDFENPAGSTFAPAVGYAVPFWTVTGILLLLPIGRLASAVQSRRRDRQEAAEQDDDTASP